MKVYSDDEQGVVNYLMAITNNETGAGDDPIGFLIASHAVAMHQLKIYKRALHYACEEIQNWGRRPIEYYQGKWHLKDMTVEYFVEQSEMSAEQELASNGK